MNSLKLLFRCSACFSTLGIRFHNLVDSHLVVVDCSKEFAMVLFLWYVACDEDSSYLLQKLQEKRFAVILLVLRIVILLRL